MQFISELRHLSGSQLSLWNLRAKSMRSCAGGNLSLAHKVCGPLPNIIYINCNTVNLLDGSIPQSAFDFKGIKADDFIALENPIHIHPLPHPTTPDITDPDKCPAQVRVVIDRAAAKPAIVQLGEATKNRFLSPDECKNLNIQDLSQLALCCRESDNFSP